MSDMSNSDVEDSMNQLLDNLDFDKKIPKASNTTNSKSLVTTSKRKPQLERQRSNSPDEGENDEAGFVDFPETKKPLEEKSTTNPPHYLPLPNRNRPKTNPNANLFGGSALFGNEKGPSASSNISSKVSQRPETVPSSNNAKVTGKVPLTTKGNPKSDLDWLNPPPDQKSGNTHLAPPIPPISTPHLQKQMIQGDLSTFDSHKLDQGSNSRQGPSSLQLPHESDDLNDFNFLNTIKQLKPNKPPPSQFQVQESEFHPQKPGLEMSDSKKQDQVEYNTDSGLLSFLDKAVMSKGKGGQTQLGMTPNTDPTTAFGLPTTKTGGGDSTQSNIVKKTVAVRKVVPSVLSSLQVPSHVIDEDELKRMSSSLKQLYENQVEMLEKSYQEQIDCLVQSYKRKEEMLKDEIKMVHKDYEERLGRLKGDLIEAETKPFLNRSQNQEYTNLVQMLSEQIKTLQLQTQILTNQNQHQPEREMHSQSAELLTKELNDILDIKLATFQTAIQTLSQRSTENVRVTDEKLIKRLEGMFSQFESQSTIYKESILGKSDFMLEMRQRIESDLSNVLKEQKKLRETLLKSTVTTMTQSLESKHEDHRKKDKISTQIREFRRDFQRLMNDIENKQDSVHKSQVSLEGEQKHISQNFHDLSTWLQINCTNHQQHLTSSSSQSQPQLQSSVQNEIELKLLKQERNSLSETIAQMNVDKRRLHDEKIQIEAEKRDLERLRRQIHDLETTLRIKISDVEDGKKQAEAFRSEHIRLSAELSRKMTEIEKERIRYRDMTQTIELHTGLQKQRQTEERMELFREREFLEKLRLQFLCPGCLRLMRSQGDGTEKTTDFQPVRKSLPSTVTAAPAQIQIPSSPVYLDIEREGQKIKEMISNYYGEMGQDIFSMIN